jgi:hypothetical protein
MREVASEEHFEISYLAAECFVESRPHVRIKARGLRAFPGQPAETDTIGLRQGVVPSHRGNGRPLIDSEEGEGVAHNRLRVCAEVVVQMHLHPIPSKDFEERRELLGVAAPSEVAVREGVTGVLAGILFPNCLGRQCEKARSTG